MYMHGVDPQIIVKAARQPTTSRPRGSWPAVLLEDASAMADKELLQRGQGLAKYILHKCDAKDNVMHESPNNAFSVHSSFVVPGTLDEVLDVFSRDPQLGFQAFLLRVFNESLAESTSLRRALPLPRQPAKENGDLDNAMPHTDDDATLFVGCTVAIKALKFDEKRFFKTVRHDVHVVDFVQKLSDQSFVRAFKSLDRDPTPTRLTNLLFGYHMEQVQDDVHVTFYGQHVGTRHTFAQSMLRQLAAATGLLNTAVWRRRLVRLMAAPSDGAPAMATECYICSHMLSRRTQTQCKLCERCICTYCSQVERAESSRTVEFDIRVCHVCLAQCQANLRLTNKVTRHKPLKKLHALASKDVLEHATVLRMSEILGGDQGRLTPMSSRQADSTPTNRSRPLVAPSRRVLSAAMTPRGIQAFTTPRGVTGNYVAPLRPTTPASSDAETSSTPSTSQRSARSEDSLSATQAASDLPHQDELDEDILAPSKAVVNDSTTCLPSPFTLTRAMAPPVDKSVFSLIRVSPQAETLRQNAFLNAPLTAKLEAMCASLAGGLHCRHAYVSLLYKGGFFLKAASSGGETPPRLPRIPKSCAFNVATLALGNDTLVVGDATMNPRFASSPRVGGPEFTRFYVGLTLYTADGIELGTVAASDVLPRDQFTPTHRRLLQWFAATIVDEIEQSCR